MINIIYEDEDVLVVEKPSGVESQQAGAFSKDMISEIKAYICHRDKTCGNFYIGVVHRLDKPVRGVMVYAKNQSAAASLSKQVQDKSEKGMEKDYYALVAPTKEGLSYLEMNNKKTLCSNLVFQKQGNYSMIIKDDEVKSFGDRVQKAELSYEVVPLDTFPDFSDAIMKYQSFAKTDEASLRLLRVRLRTGRHHQIRAQLSSIGCPLVGDRKYNKTWNDNVPGFRMIPLCLCAYRLGFVHPSTHEKMVFTISSL